MMPRTLLLADDSLTIQRVIELTFADEDIDIVAVADGDQALARLNTMPPDIVLADVGIPGKSGYEVAEYVKQTPRLSHIPVLLLTGAFEPVDQVRAVAAGCDGVLAKPFEPQLVIGRVKELLDRTARSAASLDAGLFPSPAPSAGFWSENPPPTGETPSAGAPTKLHRFFDRLDAVFTSVSGKSPAGAKIAASESSAGTESDWFGLKPASAPAERPELPLSSAAPLPPFAAFASPEPPVAPVRAPELAPVVATAEVVEKVGEVRTRPLPGLADAFAVMLAAEQGAPEPLAPPAWPSNALAGTAVPDDLVEQVSRRVIEQLSDRVVREAVADTVSSVAERLVREEIERIRNSIK